MADKVCGTCRSKAGDEKCCHNFMDAGIARQKEILAHQAKQVLGLQSNQTWSMHLIDPNQINTIVRSLGASTHEVQPLQVKIASAVRNSKDQSLLYLYGNSTEMKEIAFLYLWISDPTLHKDLQTNFSALHQKLVAGASAPPPSSALPPLNATHHHSHVPAPFASPSLVPPPLHAHKTTHLSHSTHAPIYPSVPPHNSAPISLNLNNERNLILQAYAIFREQHHQFVSEFLHYENSVDKGDYLYKFNANHKLSEVHMFGDKEFSDAVSRFQNINLRCNGRCFLKDFIGDVRNESVNILRQYAAIGSHFALTKLINDIAGPGTTTSTLTSFLPPSTNHLASPQTTTPPQSVLTPQGIFGLVAADAGSSSPLKRFGNKVMVIANNIGTAASNVASNVSDKVFSAISGFREKTESEKNARACAQGCKNGEGCTNHSKNLFIRLAIVWLLEHAGSNEQYKKIEAFGEKNFIFKTAFQDALKNTTVIHKVTTTELDQQLAELKKYSISDSHITDVRNAIDMSFSNRRWPTCQRTPLEGLPNGVDLSTSVKMVINILCKGNLQDLLESLNDTTATSPQQQQQQQQQQQSSGTSQTQTSWGTYQPQTQTSWGTYQPHPNVFAQPQSHSPAPGHHSSKQIMKQLQKMSPHTNAQITTKPTLVNSTDLFDPRSAWIFKQPIINQAIVPNVPDLTTFVDNMLSDLNHNPTSLNPALNILNLPFSRNWGAKARNGYIVTSTILKSQSGIKWGYVIEIINHSHPTALIVQQQEFSNIQGQACVHFYFPDQHQSAQWMQTLVGQQHEVRQDWSYSIITENQWQLFDLNNQFTTAPPVPHTLNFGECPCCYQNHDVISVNILMDHVAELSFVASGSYHNWLKKSTHIIVP